MPRCRDLKGQFTNPIVHMDRNGNGYCRIQEFWNSMGCKPYSDETEADMPEDKPSCKAEVMGGWDERKASHRPQSKVKFGTWSKDEHKKIRKLINDGITDVEELASIMNRSVFGVKMVANRLIIKKRKAV